MLAAEEEAKDCSITKKHVEIFDKIKKRRRIIDKAFKTKSADEEAIDTNGITHAHFTEMFRAHIKRKKLRRKIRSQPQEQVSAIKEYINTVKCRVS